MTRLTMLKYPLIGIIAAAGFGFFVNQEASEGEVVAAQSATTVGICEQLFGECSMPTLSEEVWASIAADLPNNDWLPPTPGETVYDREVHESSITLPGPPPPLNECRSYPNGNDYCASAAMWAAGYDPLAPATTTSTSSTTTTTSTTLRPTTTSTSTTPTTPPPPTTTSTSTTTSSVPSGSYVVVGGGVGAGGPVDPPPTVNTGRAGRTYSVQWRLTTLAGEPVTALSAVSSTAVSSLPCATFTGASDPVGAESAGGAGLTVLSNGTYRFNWKTPSTPGCSRFTVTLSDGQQFHANFELTA